MTAPAEAWVDSEPLRGLERFRLEWLISFVASAHHGGVSAAARVLYRSQPRVSSHVAELEQALGVQLFDRSARPVRLTVDGRAILNRAEEVLEALRSLSAEAADSQPRELRLAADASAAAYVYPRMATELARIWPSRRLVLRDSFESVDLTGESWDLAIAPSLFGALPFGVDSVALWSEPLVAVLRPDHPFAQPRINITLSNLDGVSLISQSCFAPEHYGIVDELDVVARTAQPETMTTMVSHGMGVGLLSGLAALSANSSGVVFKPIVDPHCRRTFSLWWRHRRFGEHKNLLRMLASRIPEPPWPWNDGVARLMPAAS